MKHAFKFFSLFVTMLLLMFALPVNALAKQDYLDKGLLPFKGEPYFKLGKLDKLGRPTWAHIQFHDFIEAKPDKLYKNPKKKLNGNTGYMTDYLPGFQGNDEYYLIPSDWKQGYMQEVWSPRHLLSILWTNYDANVASNFSLFTSYAVNGFPLDNRTGLVTLRDYERALDDWTSTSSRYWSRQTGHKQYMVDYKIELIYQGDELVPRQIKLRYVGLDEKGKLKKIDLEGEEAFDKNSIATVIIENIAPNVTIDYKTGKVSGNVYIPKSSNDPTDTTYDETEELYVYVNLDNGYYYYDVDNPDNYLRMIEKEALEEGYIWDAAE